MLEKFVSKFQSFKISKMRCLALGILLMLPTATIQRSDPSSLSYIGAVVEYSPVTRSKNGEDITKINAENYVKFVKKAAEFSADILVFPESSLTPGRLERAVYVPDPEDKLIPCQDDEVKQSDTMKIISCAAQQFEIYIVINLHEKANCTDKSCRVGSFLMYNTNVVFDRNGRVIAKYRKYNLFGEPGTSITSEPMISTFATDFGVKFGQFICFDLLFQTPALNLTQNLEVTDIVYPTHWFSELPFLSSLAAQAAWSYTNDVNFLASAYKYPETASDGTGIYIGREGYAHVVAENRKSNVLVVSEIPKVINGKRALNINRQNVRIYDFDQSEISTTEALFSGKYGYKSDSTPFTTELIDPKVKSLNTTLCDHEFCCTFNLKINFDESKIERGANYYKYRLAVFNGTRSFSGVAEGKIKVCGLMACTGESKDSCNKLISSNKTVATPTTFEAIEMSIPNTTNQNVFYMPITLTTQMIPLNVTDFHYNVDSSRDTSTHSMNLIKSRNNLLSFAIYGRDFNE